MAARILDLDLSRPVSSTWGMERYDKFHALVRYKNDVLGWTEGKHPIGHAVLTDERLRDTVAVTMAWPLSQALLREQLTPPAPEVALPPITVVVCCHGRPAQLAACLAAIDAANYPSLEVIVANSGADNEIVAQTARRFGANYVNIDHPSVDLARNHAAALAQHDILAFTVDRARPDMHWLHTLGRLFADPEVNAITGLVAPAELDTEAQHLAEYAYGASYKLERNTFSRKREPRLLARYVGSGANLALRRNVLDSLKGFDPALSADGVEGTGDLELLHRLIARGHTLHYEPSAIVWLSHERAFPALSRRVYNNGRYAGAYLIACARKRTYRRRTILKFVVRDWLYARLLKRLIKPGWVPRHLVFQEIRGAVAASFAYAAGRTFAKKVHKTIPSRSPSEHPAPMSAAPQVAPRPTPTLPHARPADPNALKVEIVRTWYPHWGSHAGMNQYLKHIDHEKVHISERLIHESDYQFPLRNGHVRNWLRHRVQREGMAWYNLSDFTGEMRTLPYYFGKSNTRVLHYLDGEHSAQFLSRHLRTRSRPALIATYHQPPDVLARVARLDVAASFDCLTVVSPDQQAYFLEHLRDTPVRLILHGIDTDYYRPAPGAPGAPSAGNVRCITVGHNYRDYAAVKAVAERLSSVSSLEFHVVSPRPTGLEHLANVRCYSGVSDDELLQLYQNADILLLPLTKATANNSLLEGMACGLPVISTALPALEAYVRPGAAMLIEANHVERLAEAVRHLVENPAARQDMGQEARRRAEELDWRNIGGRFQALYTELGVR